MVITGFGCVGHVRLCSWPSGCYCRYKMTGASVFYAKHTDFLRFRDAVRVPPLPRCPPMRHIGRCTHKAGSHSRRSCRRLQPRFYTCLISRHPRMPPKKREGTHKRKRRAGCCHGLHFRDGHTFFQKYMWAISDALFYCTPIIGLGGKIVNNQF